MQIQQIKIKEAVNKAYLREKVNRVDIELFKANFTGFLSKINTQADQEHLKSLLWYHVRICY